MSENNELKNKMSKVMQAAIKLSSNYQGKGTILEGKSNEYKMRLMENIQPNSVEFKKLQTDSPDFNLMLSKGRKALDDLKENNYSPKVKTYVNDIVYMFENEFKSLTIAIRKYRDVEKTELIEEKNERKINKIEPILKQDDIVCSCGKTRITNEDMIRYRKINEYKKISCKKCGDELLTLVPSENKIKTIINKSNKQEEDLDMSSLNLITEI